MEDFIKQQKVLKMKAAAASVTGGQDVTAAAEGKIRYLSKDFLKASLYSAGEHKNGGSDFICN